ncbi:MAG: hypothetical protein RBS48_01390 [Ignavibacteriaceae bacterium]|jgi:hypothetical protein|nr:hypothetical protein [Ignavibacteriaceae bacterium]
MKPKLLILFLIAILISCDAERINPLDPKNPNYKLVSLDGFVKTLTGPPRPLANVNVLWKNNNILIQTNAQGYFKIENLETKDGWLFFEKEGFSPDSFYVTWGIEKNKTVESFLNANPVMQNLTIYTIVQNRFPDIQTYRLGIQADISDEENDVDSVFVINKKLNFNKILLYNPSTRFYENNFSLSDLNLTSIDDAVGNNFNIIIKDKSGKVFDVGSSSLIRIIKQEIIINSPANKQVVTTKPKLEWKRFLPGFNFRYMIEVFTDEISPVLIYQKDNINKDEINYILESEIPVGDYFWVIWCIDDFQNRSRSKPGSFVVQ